MADTRTSPWLYALGGLVVGGGLVYVWQTRAPTTPALLPAQTSPPPPVQVAPPVDPVPAALPYPEHHDVAALTDDVLRPIAAWTEGAAPVRALLVGTLQQQLTALGFPVAPVDALMDLRTRDALRAFFAATPERVDLLRGLATRAAEMNAAAAGSGSTWMGREMILAVQKAYEVLRASRTPPAALAMVARAGEAMLRALPAPSQVPQAPQAPQAPQVPVHDAHRDRGR